MSHTKGPWFNHGDIGLFDNRTGGPSIQDRHGNVVCAVEVVDADADDEINGRRLADAYLIAAAPDMFYVLERILTFAKLTNTERLMIEACLDGAKGKQ